MCTKPMDWWMSFLSPCMISLHEQRRRIPSASSLAWQKNKKRGRPLHGLSFRRAKRSRSAERASVIQCERSCQLWHSGELQCSWITFCPPIHLFVSSSPHSSVLGGEGKYFFHSQALSQPCRKTAEGRQTFKPTCMWVGKDITPGFGVFSPLIYCLPIIHWFVFFPVLMD